MSTRHEQPATRAPLWRSDRWLDDRGFAGGADMLFFGFIALGISVLVIVNTWAVIDTSLAVNAAAREGARTFVEADPADPFTDSRRAMDRVMDQYGKTDAADLRVEIIEGVGFERCAVVRTSAAYDIELIDLPLFGSLGSHRISATHSERVDPFRSGAFFGECP